MKTISGNVISLQMNVPIRKVGSADSYNGWQFIYKTSEGKVDTINKPMKGLEYQPSLKQGLEQLTPGDDFTLDMEKNEKGFWDILSVSKGQTMPTAVKEKAAFVGQNTSPSRYQTDRGVKNDEVQRLIVRQSSLAQAVAFSNTNKAKTAEEVLELASTFENWVMRTTVTNEPPVEAA